MIGEPRRVHLEAAIPFPRPIQRGFRTLALLLVLAPGARAQEHPISFTLSASPARVAPGADTKLTLTAIIPSGWHFYSISQPPGGPIATTIAVGPEPRFTLAGTIDGSMPSAAPDPNFGMVTETHEDSAVYHLPVRVATAAPAGRNDAEVLVYYQVCNNRYCLPPREDTVRVALAVSGPPVSAAPLPALPEATPASAPAPVAAAAVAASDAAPAPVREQGRAAGLWSFLWLAMAMGALSLLTPCVFPMVPITISYFSRQERASRAEAVADAVLYAGGIVGAFTALGLGFALLAGVAGMNRFAASPVLNLAIAALFVVFALSLLGKLEVALPSGLVNWLYQASSGSRFGRVGTTLLMGVTFAVTTFTCTAPFVGTLLVTAAAGDWRWPMLGLLAFSTVFALPFLFLALVPRAVAQLPRSGQWLATVKGTLGFIELAAAFKFISNADLVLGWNVFTRDVVLAIWVLLAVLLVLYLAGVRPRRPFLAPARYPLGALATLLVAVWLATGIGGRRLGELDSFLPPVAHGQEREELPWLLDDYDGALAAARSEGRLVLIDFTGYTCTNCRWMEANMFPRADVTRELERFVRVRLFTDGREEYHRRQQAFEQEKFGTVALPLYAIVDSTGAARATFLGMTRDAREFLRFLNSAGGAAPASVTP